MGAEPGAEARTRGAPRARIPPGEHLTARDGAPCLDRARAIRCQLGHWAPSTTATRRLRGPVNVGGKVKRRPAGSCSPAGLRSSGGLTWLAGPLPGVEPEITAAGLAELIQSFGEVAAPPAPAGPGCAQLRWLRRRLGLRRRRRVGERR